MASPTAIAAYLTLFFAVGFLFLLANLAIGWLIRPHDPHAEKLEIYECGEPTIGSSFVQFDLRFYVVALVFIVFDAEVAFLFPAATVFGKQTQLADATRKLDGEAEAAATSGLIEEMTGKVPEAGATMASDDDITKFTWYVYAATLVFFFVLFVGFAYEWKTGAFDWVRAVTKERGSRASPAPQLRVADSEPALTS